MKTKCDIYKCARKADTYLYVSRDMAVDELPEGLHQLLGKLSQFMSLDLDESSKLAQVKTRDVLQALNDQGFFLQMPPAERLREQSPGSAYIQ